MEPSIGNEEVHLGGYALLIFAFFVSAAILNVGKKPEKRAFDSFSPGFDFDSADFDSPDFEAGDLGLAKFDAAGFIPACFEPDDRPHACFAEPEDLYAHLSSQLLAYETGGAAVQAAEWE